MLFKVECQHCGAQTPMRPGAQLVENELPAGWTADAVVKDGDEPWTLCPASTAAWRQAQQQQRDAFVAASPRQGGGP